MEITNLDLTQIDFDDKTFSLGNHSPLSTLTDSITKVGLINPPVLRIKDNKYQIVTGWKRLFSSKELGLKTVQAKVYNPSELTDSDSLNIIYLDNNSRLSDLELAEIIVLYRELCSANDLDLLENILPELGIPSNRKNLDKYLALSSLDVQVKNAFSDEKITIEQCIMLSELDLDSQVSILNRVLLEYKLNNNESRQVIQIISETALRDKKSSEEVVNQAEIAINSDKKNKNELRLELKKIRYPDLLDVEEKYSELVQKLNLPKDFNIFVNQYFEGNDFELRMKVKSSEELSQHIDFLDRLIKSRQIDTLLDTIKSGSK